MKTKLFLMTFAFFALLLVGNLNAQFSGGLGTEQNPYQITSRTDMEALADSVNNGYNWSKGKYFRVMNDIPDSVTKMIGREYEGDTTVPSSPTYATSFKGHFNGGGHKITLSIKNIIIADTIVDPLRPFTFYQANAAMFYALVDATIDSVDVDGYLFAAVDTNLRGTGRCAGIAMWSIGKCLISNCNNYISVPIPWNFIDYDTVTLGAYHPGTYYPIYGIIYRTRDFITILNCNNYGNLFGVGIVGHGESGIFPYAMSVIKNCNNYGNIVGWGGGIAISGFDSIINCNNYGNIRISDPEGAGSHGGIVGRVSEAYISNCNNYGDIYVNTHNGGVAAGIVGGADSYENTTTIINCHNYGNIYGISVLGGILGVGNQSDDIKFVRMIVKDCTNEGDIFAYCDYCDNGRYKPVCGTTIGGISVGINGYIINCTNKGNFSTDAYDAWERENTDIEVGGIVGRIVDYDFYFDPKKIVAKVEKSINIGTLRSKFTAGGIIGSSIAGSEITNCINAGLVDGKGIAGGIIGSSLFGTIKNCLNTGVVKGNTEKIGCIAGENINGTIINCHYDKQMCNGGE